MYVFFFFLEKISSNFKWQDVGTIIIIMLFIISLLWIYFYKGKDDISVQYPSIIFNCKYFIEVHGININSRNTLQHNIENLPPSYDSSMKLDNYVTGKKKKIQAC